MNILILILLILFPTLSNATSWKIDDLYTFTTSTNGSAGIVDADSVPTYRIYEDETGTAVLTGSMAKLDDAGTTGFYSEQVTLSAANGFEKGKSYNIIICAAISSTTACATDIFQIEMEVDANVVSDKTGYTASTVSDKSGYSLAADQSAVTIGTTNTVTNGVTLADDAITATKIAAGAFGLSEIGSTGGTVTTGSCDPNTTLTFDTDMTQAGVNHWKDAFITFKDDTTTVELRGQTKVITSSAVNGCLTVRGGFTVAPASGDTFVIINK